MRNIIYYVATSIDGFICGPDEDISLFSQESDGIQKYFEDLKQFDTVLMGRKTYELGFKFGIEPGQTPYKHMTNYIISNTAHYSNPAENVHVIPPEINEIKAIKNEVGTDIYLCGGGVLATWLLENQLIDQIKLKLNPFIFGTGTQLFENLNIPIQLQYIQTEEFSHGLIMITYSIKYII